MSTKRKANGEQTSTEKSNVQEKKLKAVGTADQKHVKQLATKEIQFDKTERTDSSSSESEEETEPAATEKPELAKIKNAAILDVKGFAESPYGKIVKLFDICTDVVFSTDTAERWQSNFLSTCISKLNLPNYNQCPFCESKNVVNCIGQKSGPDLCPPDLCPRICIPSGHLWWPGSPTVPVPKESTLWEALSEDQRRRLFFGPLYHAAMNDWIYEQCQFMKQRTLLAIDENERLMTCIEAVEQMLNL